MSATVQDAEIAASHDGAAEVLLTIKHENGGLTRVPLDYFAVSKLMESCQADSIEGIIGTNWDKVRDAIQASHNQ
tara:strand:- start:339 stop:563 length:225 start_codon:yes stop_codon:yes gene_type:complete